MADDKSVLHLATGQVPVVNVNFPKMPTPEDFGIDWEGAAVMSDENLYSRGDLKRKYRAKREAYSEALAAWKEAVVAMSQALKTGR